MAEPFEFTKAFLVGWIYPFAIIHLAQKGNYLAAFLLLCLLPLEGVWAARRKS